VPFDKRTLAGAVDRSITVRVIACDKRQAFVQERVSGRTIVAGPRLENFPGMTKDGRQMDLSKKYMSHWNRLRLSRKPQASGN
jgi:hypothetical protein